MTTEAPVESAGAGLSDRQRRFCEEYAVHAVGARAALEAGYSAAQPANARFEAAHLLTHHNVRAYIEELRTAHAEELAVTAEDVARRAWEIANDPEANQGAQVSALNLLGKRTGGFVERSEVEHTGEVTIQRNTPDLR